MLKNHNFNTFQQAAEYLQDRLGVGHTEDDIKQYLLDAKLTACVYSSEAGREIYLSADQVKHVFCGNQISTLTAYNSPQDARVFNIQILGAGHEIIKRENLRVSLPELERFANDYVAQNDQYLNLREAARQLTQKLGNEFLPDDLLAEGERGNIVIAAQKKDGTKKEGRGKKYYLGWEEIRDFRRDQTERKLYTIFNNPEDANNYNRHHSENRSDGEFTKQLDMVSNQEMGFMAYFNELLVRAKDVDRLTDNLNPYPYSELITEFADPLPHDNICYFWETTPKKRKEREQEILSAVVCKNLAATVYDRNDQRIKQELCLNINREEMIYKGEIVRIMVQSANFKNWLESRGEKLPANSPLNGWINKSPLSPAYSEERRYDYSNQELQTKAEGIAENFKREKNRIPTKEDVAKELFKGDHSLSIETYKRRIQNTWKR